MLPQHVIYCQVCSKPAKLALNGFHYCSLACSAAHAAALDSLHEQLAASQPTEVNNA